MAVTWRPAEITVVGFCGLPISAATAMTAPVFEGPAGRYFVGDPDSVVPPRAFMEREELEHQQEAGYLTLTAKHWARQPGGVVLYAHPGFLNPGEAYCSLSPSDLAFDTCSGVHLDYVPRPRALMLLHRWGRLLADDASRMLSGRPTAADIDRAMDSAQRALFCAPPPEHKQLRMDAFVALAASYHVRKRPAERLYREMKLDFDEVAVDTICQRAAAKAAGAHAYPPKDSGPASDPADGPRFRLTVSRAEPRAA